jgi:hypothetical protein
LASSGAWVPDTDREADGLGVPDTGQEAGGLGIPDMDRGAGERGIPEMDRGAGGRGAPGGEPNGGVPELARTAVRAGRARGTRAGRSSRLDRSESGAAGNLFGIGDQGPERDVRMAFSDAAGGEDEIVMSGPGWTARRVSGFWGSIRSGVITWSHSWTGQSGAWAAESGSVASSSWDAARWVTAPCAFTLSNDLGRPGAARD